ncbi:phage shock protein A [Paenibacillus macquariensis subsp. defensor]|nr:phage shock protein A [Paenibacillus macquariensis subsp. defensor]
MGILSRFKDIMASNINALLDKAEDPEKMIDDYMRQLNSDMGKVKAETASVLADEQRAKRVLDECRAEIRKLLNYAEKAVESGDEEKALKFLERKAIQVEKQNQLQVAYDAASANALSMKRMQDKIVLDMGQLEVRRVHLKEKIAATKAQQQLNSRGGSLGANGSVLDAMEEKVNQAYNEAVALAELRAEPKDDLDDLIAQLEKSMNANPEDELAAMKDQIKNKE